MNKHLAPSLYQPSQSDDFLGSAHRIAKLLTKKSGTLNASGTGIAKILLIGNPGVGKTRLAEMFALQLAGHASQIESVNGRNVSLDLVRRWQEEMRYFPMMGKFSVRIVNELDTAPTMAQDLLLTFLDEMPRNTAFIGTSNLKLSQLTERFQSRLQSFRVDAPSTEEIAGFLIRMWQLTPNSANQIAVGSGGNVRAAFMDAQCSLDDAAVVAA